MLRNAFGTAIFIAVLVMPSLAQAQTKACTVSTSGINFGVVSLQNNSNLDSTGTLEVLCTRGNASYTISLSSGGGSIGQRHMVANGRFLNYNIFTGANYTQVWGDGSAGSGTVTGNANQNQPRIHTLYGRIPLQSVRDAYSGSYSDNLVVTIAY